MRCVSTLVLPEPAPATMSSAGPRYSTASRCCGIEPVGRGARRSRVARRVRWAPRASRPGRRGRGSASCPVKSRRGIRHASPSTHESSGAACTAARADAAASTVLDAQPSSARRARRRRGRGGRRRCRRRRSPMTSRELRRPVADTPRARCRAGTAARGTGSRGAASTCTRRDRRRARRRRARAPVSGRRCCGVARGRGIRRLRRSDEPRLVHAHAVEPTGEARRARSALTNESYLGACRPRSSTRSHGAPVALDEEDPLAPDAPCREPVEQGRLERLHDEPLVAAHPTRRRRARRRTARRAAARAPRSGAACLNSATMRMSRRCSSAAVSMSANRSRSRMTG